MITRIQIGENELEVDFSQPIDISIPLDFHGPQPNAFSVDPASAAACEYGSLVGDTRRGGSCNFERVTFIPHCNGTHTECIGHITNERISLRDCLKDVLLPATLISVEPEFLLDELVVSDLAIREAIKQARVSAGGLALASTISRPALIIRTLPNDGSKLAGTYDSDNIPPYFTQEAMNYVVESSFKHLLVDLPSIDRLYDDGQLLNHRIFWNVEPGSFELSIESRTYATITELIYVPSQVLDGEYLLNLQIAPFVADAAPSRPILFRNL